MAGFIAVLCMAFWLLILVLALLVAAFSSDTFTWAGGRL